MTIPSPTDENISNKPNSLTVQKYHSFVRHLRLTKDGSTSSRLRIAKHHFHPKVVTSEGKIFSTTDRGTGEAIGLTKFDQSKQSKGDNDYYIVGPNCSITAAEMHHNTFVGLGKPTLTRKSEEMAEKEADMKECEEKRKKQKLEAIERAELVDIHSQLDERLSKLLHDREEKIRHDYMKQIKARDSMIKELSEQKDGFAKELLECEKKYTEVKLKQGMSRETLSCDEWHDANPLACKEVYGFPTFFQLKVFLRCMFEEFSEGGEGKFETALTIRGRTDVDAISEFEKCLITVMRFHLRPTIKFLSAIWGRDSSRISRYIHEWAPKLGDAGLDLSILHITPEFLKHAMPRNYKDLGMDNVCCLVDGKVFMTHECRQHNGIKRAMCCDKVHHAGVLCHNWILPYGLTVEHTPLYLGRLSEPALVKLWGSSTKRELELDGSTPADADAY